MKCLNGLNTVVGCVRRSETIVWTSPVGREQHASTQLVSTTQICLLSGTTAGVQLISKHDTEAQTQDIL